MTVVAGLRFSFEPEDALNGREREALRDTAPSAATRAASPPVRIRLEPRALSSGRDAAPAPARVDWDGARLRLTHAAFDAEIDGTGATAVVRSDPDSAAGLVATLRTALSARLPLAGGVLFHAAAFDRDGEGLVFFGPSGIGKSTLAARAPWPALSDELVAVLPARGDEPHRVAGAAFPAVPSGPTEAARQPRLAALFELAQGPRFELQRLDARAALRRLLGSLVVPPGPPFWSAALGVAGLVVREAPCYRMAWSLDESPFERLALALAEETALTAG